MTARLFWRQAAAVAMKDLRIEVRARESLNLITPFAAMTLLAFGFAFGPGRTELRQAAAPLIWLAVLFAALLALRRSYEAERQNGALEGLVMAAADRAAIFLGKLAAVALVLFVLQAIALTLVGLLFGFSGAPDIALIAASAVLGSLGLAIIGSFYSAMAAIARAREALLPLLVLPVIVPVLIAAIKVSAAGFGQTVDGVGGWIRLLVAFDVVALAVCTVAFEHLVEE